MSATFYTIMMAVAFSLSGIFLIVAIILFFKLRIRMVIEELSGRRARKQVAEIRKENTATKSRGYVPEIFGDNESKPNVTSSKEEAKKRITEMLIAQTNDNSDEDTGGTVLLNDVINDTEREEGTTVLGMSSDNDNDDTTILVEEDEGTTLLSTDEELQMAECKVVREIVVAESSEFLKVE